MLSAQDTTTLLRKIVEEMTGLRGRVEAVEKRLEKGEKEWRGNAWGLKEVKVQMLGQQQQQRGTTTTTVDGGAGLRDLCSDIREDLGHITRLSASVSDVENTLLRTQLDLQQTDAKLTRTTNEVTTLRQAVKNTMTGAELEHRAVGLRRAAYEPMPTVSKSLEIAFESEEHMKRLHHENKKLRRELKKQHEEATETGHHDDSRYWARNLSTRDVFRPHPVVSRVDIAERIVAASHARHNTVVTTPQMRVQRVSSLRSAKSQSPPVAERHAMINVPEEEKEKEKPPVVESVMQLPPAKSTAATPPTTPPLKTKRKHKRRPSTVASSLPDETSSIDFNEPTATSPGTSSASSSLALQSISASATTASKRRQHGATSSYRSSSSGSVSSLEFIDA